LKVMIKKEDFNIGDIFPFFERDLNKVLSSIKHNVPPEKIAEIHSIFKSLENHVDSILNKMRQIGLFVNDLQHNRVYPNSYWYRWGYTEEDMKHLGYLELIHPDDLDRVKKMGIPNNSNINNSMVLFRLRTKTGEWRWILSSTISITRNEDGSINQYIGFDHDITEEMEAKEVLQAALLQAEAAKQEAEARALEANTLREISTIITSELDLNTTINAILTQAEKILSFDTASVQILNGNILKIVGGHGWRKPDDLIGIPIPIPGDNPNTRVIQSGKPLIIGDIIELYPSMKDFFEEYEGHSWIGFPLIIREAIIGMLTFDKKEKNFFTVEHRNIGKSFASHVAIALDNARNFQRINNLSMTDPLTEISNRRAFFNQMDYQEKLFKRYGTNFSMIMLDIDFFKKINDKYGHQTGDRVLKDIADEIKVVIRDSDIVFRYGGDEFAVILSQSDEADAFEIAERIRREVKNNIKLADKNDILTICSGCASFSSLETRTIDKLISSADNALYYAKRNRRNKTINASDLS